MVQLQLPAALQSVIGTAIVLINAGPLEALSDLRGKISSVTSVPAGEQQLSFSAGNTIAADEMATLSSLGIGHGAHLKLDVLTEPDTSLLFVVHVELVERMRAAYGERVSMILEPTEATVGLLKARLASMIAVVAEEQILIFGAVRIDRSSDETLLSAMGIASGDTIALSLVQPVLAVYLPAKLARVFGESLALQLDVSSTSLAEVKTQIQSAVGIAGAVQTLHYQGQALRAASMVAESQIQLSLLGVTPGGPLELRLPSAAIPALVVKVLLPPSLQPSFGLSLVLGSTLSTTISQLKAQIEVVTSTPVLDQLLMHGSRVLTIDSEQITRATSLSTSQAATKVTLSLHLRIPTVHVRLSAALQASLGVASVEVRASTSTSAGVVKARLEPMVGVPAESQLLFAGPSVHFIDPSANLGSAGVPAGGPLDLDLNVSSMPRAFNFAVVVELPADKAAFGPRITLRLQRGGSTTFAEIKRSIETITGMGRAQQLLSVGGVPFLADTSTLESANLQSGSVLQLSAALSTIAVKLPFQMRAAFGERVLIAADASNTLGFVTQHLEARLSVPSAQLSLSNAATGTELFGGPDVTLASLGVAEGSELVLDTSSVETNRILIYVDLPASLQSTFGTTLSVAVLTSTTVADLKDKLELSVNVLTDEQLLSFGVVALTSESMALTSLGIRDGDRFTLAIRPLSIQVYMPSGSALATTFGASITLEVGPFNTIAEVKDALKTRVGVQASDQTLLNRRNGRALAPDTSTLGSHSVRAEDAVQLHLPSAADALAFIVHIDLPAERQQMHGVALTLPASAVLMVGELKAAVAQSIGGSLSSLQLAFRGDALCNDATALGARGIVSGDRLTLTIKAPYMNVQLPDEMRLTFGTTVTIPASTTTSLGEAKSMLTAMIGVPPALQTLRYLHGNASTPIIGPSTGRLGELGVHPLATLVLGVDDGATLPSFVIRIQLPTRLQPTFGSSLRIPLPAANETLMSLYETIASRVSLSPTRQILAFGGNALDRYKSAESVTMDSLGVVNGDTLVLSEIEMYVTVRLPPSYHQVHGPSLSVLGGSAQTVMAVAKDVGAVIGRGEWEVELGWNGLSLFASRATLGELALSPGDPLDLLQPAGPHPSSTDIRIRVQLPAELSVVHGSVR